MLYLELIPGILQKKISLIKFFKIYDILNYDAKVTKEMIIYSFKKQRINLRLDNTEKNLINVSDELIDKNDILDSDDL